jgi:hypothetical protein
VKQRLPLAAVAVPVTSQTIGANLCDVSLDRFPSSDLPFIIL